MKKISSEGKDLRMMGILMGLPLYIDVSSLPEAVRDEKEQTARAILYQATQALVLKTKGEQQSEEDQQ